jgi:hypothetical protein
VNYIVKKTKRTTPQDFKKASNYHKFTAAVKNDIGNKTDNAEQTVKVNL